MSDDQERNIIRATSIKILINGVWYPLANSMTFEQIDCQDEPPPFAQTPEEADEILDRWQNG